MAAAAAVQKHQDHFWSNKAECDDAEERYYRSLYGKKADLKDSKADDGGSDDDVDLFGPSPDDDDNSAKKPFFIVKGKGSCSKAAAPPQKVNKPSEVKDDPPQLNSGPISSLAAEIAKARQHIKSSLECVDGLAVMANSTGGAAELAKKISKLELENKALKKTSEDLQKIIAKLEARVTLLEGGGKGKPAAAAPAGAAAKPKDNDDDDDVDLFGSDSEEEDAEKAKVREERLKAYQEKKSKKPALIAKTSVVLDIKPWDDETDMNEMLKAAKSIEKDGLVWGASKLVPVGYGISKLQLMCVVEDEKVSIEELCEQIQEFEDYVQSVDVAAMNKI